MTRATSVVIDCRDSHNVISNHNSLIATVEVPPKSSVVVASLHLLLEVTMIFCFF